MDNIIGWIFLLIIVLLCLFLIKNLIACSREMKQHTKDMKGLVNLEDEE